MAPTVIVLVFPLITAMAFGLLVAAYRAVGGWSAVRRLDTHGLFWYSLFLLAPLAWILGSADARTVVDDASDSLAPGVGALLVVGAVVLGGGLYLLDLWVALQGRRLAARRPALGAVLEGRAGTLAGVRAPLAALLAFSVGIAVVEEVLWRGYLLGALRDLHGWSTLAALAITSLSYGAVHYYFGLRNVLVKSLHGAVWGALLLLGGSLVLPVLSHVTFELLAARGLRRVAARPSEAVESAPY